MKQLLVFVFLLTSITLQFGQGFVPVLTGLGAPSGVTNVDSTLWLTVTGTGNNDGMVLSYAPDGTVDTVLVGLSSFLDTSTMETVGAWRALPRTNGGMLLVQGAGPDTVYSSTIILFDTIDLSNGPMTYANASMVIPVGAYVLENVFEESNPFSAVEKDGVLYISDAAANAIIAYDMVLGEFSTFATFASFMNPTPVGPPFIHIVPTKIIEAPEGGFYVSSLTGFPFISGASNIYHVNDTGAVSIAYQGLSLVTDISLDPEGNLVALQFANFGPMGFDIGSSILTRIDTMGSLDTIASGFGPSPGFTYTSSGDLFATHLFFGQLLKYDKNITGVADNNGLDVEMSVSPNPVQDWVNLRFSLHEAKRLSLMTFDLQGRQLTNINLGYQSAGFQSMTFDRNQLRINNTGLYIMVLTDGTRYDARKIVVK